MSKNVHGFNEADIVRFEKMKLVIEDLYNWFHNNLRVEKMQKLYGELVDPQSVIAEMYVYYPPKKSSDIIGLDANYSQREHMVALPFMKILNCAKKNPKGIKPGQVYSISDSYVGFLQDKRWEEAQRATKMRAVGSDTGKPLIVDMPAHKTIQAFRSFDDQSFSLDKLSKELGDVTTYYISTAYLYVEVKKDAMIDYMKETYGVK